jgi:hypothetical protein
MRKVVLPVIVFLFISCNKQPYPATSVLLRIKNETSKSFTQVITTNESFNNVQAMSTTDYQPFQQIVSVPSAILISSSDTAYAGLIVIDYQTYITTGKYTLEIKTDTLAASGYNCAYIKQ